MNFITNLFVSRHHRKELFEPPFDAAVLAELEGGRIPVVPTRGHSRCRASGGGHGTDGARVLSVTPVVPPSKGTDMFTDSQMETLRVTGDAPADAAVAAFFEATDAAHAQLFRALASGSAQAVADDDLPGIGTFATRVEAWPEWADPELVRDGQRVFGEFGPQLGMGLFMASLPSDYAFARGVQVLARTARLTHNPKRRYVETGQMIIDVMTPGALEAIAVAEATGDDAVMVRVLNHLHLPLQVPSMLEVTQARATEGLVRAERIGDLSSCSGPHSGARRRRRGPGTSTRWTGASPSTKPWPRNSTSRPWPGEIGSGAPSGHR